MAKQYGIHKIGGKVDGQSYYYSKNGGFVSRKINPGMSARVKEGKEYANTRLNNAEFGAAGSLAGAMVGTVSQRWRYILNSKATGLLVKEIKAAMMQDQDGEWGKRTIPLATMAGIQDAYNRFSKNEIPAEIKQAMENDFVFLAASNTLQVGSPVFISSDTVQQLTDKGANYFSCKVFAFNVTVPEIGPDGKTYVKPRELFVDITSTFGVTHALVTNNEQIISDEALPNSPKVFNEASHLGGVLVVFLPERKLGDVYYTMQELCSACWVPAKEVTA